MKRTLAFVTVAAAISSLAVAATPSPSPSPSPSSSASSSSSGSSAPAPNDPYFAQQWGLYNDGTQSIPIDVDPLHTDMQQGVAGADIGWLAASSELSKLSPSPVTVAVIDTGLDETHPDLVNRYSSQGYDFIKNSSTMSDEPDGQDPTTSDAGHGTHVSGIIAANDDNGIGITGITPSAVQILPLRILSDLYQNFAYNGMLISDYAAEALNYAVAHGASVVNLSLGWPKIVDTQNARTAFQNAINQGVLIIAAAGNDRKELPTYPCAYPGVICVGAASNNGAMAVYSDLGGMVDILAPGDSIISTYPLDVESQILRIQGYESLSGTSMASPHVAGVAATLKSVMPSISLQELEARLLVSASAPPKGMPADMNQDTSPALYGMVNLQRALNAQPQPVFLPDFKSIDEVTVDESSLQAQGQISVENLWAQATGVQAEIAVNGVSAGTAQAATLAQGGTIIVPWTYTFASLDESSLLHVSLQISDAAGDSKIFTADLPAVRAMSNIAGSQTTQLPAIAPGGPLIGQSAGQSFTNLSIVSDYPAQPGMPQYFMQHRNPQTGGIDFGAAGCLLDVIDPTNAANPVQTVEAPGIQQVVQVLRLNASGAASGSSQQLDWVIIGIGNLTSPTPYYEFYFLNPQLQPLWGSTGGSQWQIGLNNSLGQSIIRDYSSPGSWVNAGSELVPCFITDTILPSPDNFGGFDVRSYEAGEHLIYLLPQAQSGSNPIQLTPRGLDSATFRAQFASNPNLKTIIPSNAADSQVGHVRALLTVGTELNAQTLLWDIPNISSTTTATASGWDQLSTSGTPINVITTAGSPSQGESAYLNFYDQARGALAWATSQGQFLDQTEFDFSSTENPIAGLIGAFDLPSLGRFWFIQSQFDLVAYRQASATGDAGISSDTLPIDRDSTFPNEDFSKMFTPVVVGTTASPLPGIYIDSTLVRGDMVSVAVMNPSSDPTSTGGTLVKPLRYSLQIPPSCLQMSPVHTTAAPESFALPILCQQPGANQDQLELVFPQPGSQPVAQPSPSPLPSPSASPTVASQ